MRAHTTRGFATGSVVPPHHLQPENGFHTQSSFADVVVGGHVTEKPASITCASDISRDSVQIAFMLAALNNLDIQVLGANVAEA